MRRRLALLLLCSPLGACQVLPDRPPAPQLHDFGPLPRAARGRAAEDLVLGRVSAPAWVSTTEVHYRFLFDDPTRVRSYATSQWTASPTALLEQRLRDVLSGSGRERPGATPLYLDVRLLVFEQEFRAPDRAEAVIRLEAALRKVLDGPPVATTVIADRRPCPPNVRGAVSGLAALADGVIERLLQWAARAGSAT